MFLGEIEAPYFWRSRQEIEDYQERNRPRGGANRTVAIRSIDIYFLKILNLNFRSEFFNFTSTA